MSRTPHPSLPAGGGGTKRGGFCEKGHAQTKDTERDDDSKKNHPALDGDSQMIDLQGVCYVRLGTRDIEGATRFATDVLGLEISEVRKDAVYFRSDQREHTLCYVDGDPHEQAVAFEVGSHAALSAAATEL